MEVEAGMEHDRDGFSSFLNWPNLRKSQGFLPFDRVGDTLTPVPSRRVTMSSDGAETLV